MKKYPYAFLIWVIMIPIAILNGGFREYVLVKLGGLVRPLSGIILSVCIFLVAYLLVPKIKNCANGCRSSLCRSGSTACKGL